MDQDKKEDLVDLIERLHSQYQNSAGDDKTFLETQIRKYALKYKEVTGEWYIRDPAKNVSS